MDQKHLKYTQDHEWIRVDGEHAFVGITNFAQGELGDIVYAVSYTHLTLPTTR